MLRDQAPNSELQGHREPLDLGQLLGKLPSAPLAMKLSIIASLQTSATSLGSQASQDQHGADSDPHFTG